MLNARTQCSAGRVERISRLAQVNPAELECLLWYSPPGVLDVSVSCSSRGRFGRTRNACSASIGSMHLEETREIRAALETSALDESLSTAPFSQTIQTTHFDQVPQGGTLWQLTHPGQISWLCGIAMGRLIRFVGQKPLPCSPMSRSMRSGRSPKNWSYPRINWFSVKAR